MDNGIMESIVALKAAVEELNDMQQVPTREHMERIVANTPCVHFNVSDGEKRSADRLADVLTMRSQQHFSDEVLANEGERPTRERIAKLYGKCLINAPYGGDVSTRENETAYTPAERSSSPPLSAPDVIHGLPNRHMAGFNANSEARAAVGECEGYNHD